MAYFAYDNLLRSATVLSEQTITDFEISKGLDGRGYSRAGFLNGANRVTVFDFASTKSFNVLLIAGHNFGSVGASITLEGSADNSSWTTIGTEAITADYVLDWGFASQSYRYVRMTVLNHSASAYVADIFIGEKLTLPYGMPKGFISPDQYDTDKISTNVTGNGALAGVDVVTAPKRCKIPMNDFLRSWFDENWGDFVSSVKQFPAYFSWADGERIIYFVFYKKVGSPKFTTNNRQSVTIDVEGIV